MRSKKIKIIKRTEVEEIERHRKNRFKCQRCSDVFPEAHLLETHRIEQHGDYEINDTLRNVKNKESFREPPKTEWVIPISDTKSWWWNPWRHCYFMYILGIGVISNDFHQDKKDKNRLKEMIICDESTQYFRTWRDILFEGQQIRGEPTPKPLMKPLPKFTLPDGVILTKGYHICKNCNHIIRVIIGNHYRCKRCNHLITINEKDNSEKYYDIEKQKEYTHKCKDTNPLEIMDDVLLLCPSCGRNIFRESKDPIQEEISVELCQVVENKRRF
jgi:uncharacterized C2H2 Zn-finger protein/DNA-directed RNA polymerase subunit RPC12/RpoP